MPESIFGIPIKYETWNKKSSMPLYIAGSYDFRTAYIADKRCIMIKPTEEIATLPALKKQIMKIQEADSVPVILELRTVSPYRRKSLIENKIPFITEKQVFLPFIGTMLTDEKEPEKKVKKFVFSAQQLFLFYLYSKKKRMYVSEAAKKLPFTAMTLTRAVRQLEATGLFLITKEGVNKVIESKYERSELFENAKKYLSTPVRKMGYIDKSRVVSDMRYAGESALAEKTMLNPSRVITYAVSDKDFDKKLLTDELIDPEKQVRLELWAYAPQMFSSDNTADSLSVVLSFQDNSDERIDEAVEELTEGELKDYG
ncbi:MAG: MarR family transcriptional regulator [Lachnospiraceae bacterium]